MKKIIKYLLVGLVSLAIVVGTLSVPKNVYNKKDMEVMKFGYPIAFVTQDLTRYDPPFPWKYSFSSPLENPYFPNRNLLFLTIASAYACQNSIKIISIGLIDNVIFPDQTKKFVKGTEESISTSLGYNIKILAPLMELDKREVIGLAKLHQIPLKLTYSCYVGNQEHCGKCKACQERDLAINDPVT